MASGQDRGDGAESRRILQRVAGESEAGGAGATGPAEPPDRIEQAGTRIGRAIAFLLSAAVLAWAALFLLQRG